MKYCLKLDGASQCCPSQLCNLCQGQSASPLESIPSQKRQLEIILVLLQRHVDCQTLLFAVGFSFCWFHAALTATNLINTT